MKKKNTSEKMNGGRGCLKYVVNDIHKPDVYSKTKLTPNALQITRYSPPFL